MTTQEPMDERRRAQLERNLRLYPLFEALAFTPICMPVLVLFWEDNGLSMSDIFLLQALFSVGMVLMEVPTGMIADRLGKRTSLILAEITICISVLGYALGHGFWAFLAAELGLALGAALWSGADSALLYDTLKALGREDEYTDREGRAKSMMMISFAVANLVGGFLGEWSYRATIWASAIGPSLAILVALRLVEVNVVEKGESFREGLREYRSLLADATRFVWKHQLVRWQLGLLAVLTGSSGWLLWLYQPYMETAGLPVWAFGFAFAGCNLFAAWMSRLADPFERRFGQRGTLLGLMGLHLLSPLLMAIVIHPAAFLLVFGQQMVRGLGRPILSGRILRYTFADKRSTVLSMASLWARLFFAITAPIIGYVADAWSLQVTLVVQGGLLALILGWLWALYLRIPEKYFEVKAEVQERA